MRNKVYLLCGTVLLAICSVGARAVEQPEPPPIIEAKQAILVYVDHEPKVSAEAFIIKETYDLAIDSFVSHMAGLEATLCSLQALQTRLESAALVPELKFSNAIPQEYCYRFARARDVPNYRISSKPLCNYNRGYRRIV